MIKINTRVNVNGTQLQKSVIFLYFAGNFTSKDDVLSNFL